VVRPDALGEHVPERAERLNGAAGARKRREEGVEGGKRGGGGRRHPARLASSDCLLGAGNAPGTAVSPAAGLATRRSGPGLCD
jgi:hypothetical protein